MPVAFKVWGHTRQTAFLPPSPPRRGPAILPGETVQAHKCVIQFQVTIHASRKMKQDKGKRVIGEKSHIPD